ncbi:hypothetical protein AMECASPLE_037188 [Ameca splendens]|uniref:Uncharacterized protein n=1 Tax=Ameca splendens TaxID=208324 RepID=A0ABV1AE95_9TELE
MATTTRQGPGTLSTPHPNSGGTLACRSPTILLGTPRRTKQASWPAPPTKRSHIPINATHCLVKTLSPVSPQPTEWHRSQGPRSKEIQVILREPKRQSRHQSIPNPQDPKPNPSPDPDQKVRFFSRPLLYLFIPPLYIIMKMELPIPRKLHKNGD